MKRPCLEGQEPASSKPMDAKRPKEDMEHAMLVKVFQPAQQPPNKLNMATVSDYLELEVSRMVAANPAKGLDDALQFLAKGWRRSEEGGVVPSTWQGIQPLQETIMTVALTQVVSATSDEKVRVLSLLMDGQVPSKLINELLVAAAEDEAVPPRLVKICALALKGRHLNEPRTQQFAKLMRVLKANKTYVTALVSSPCKEELFCPAFESRFHWRNKKKEVIAKQRPGNMLQTKTLLGWVLSPTALDSALMPPSMAHQSEAGSGEWQDLSRATRQRVELLKRGTQGKVSFVQSQAAELAETVLRAGDAPRQAILEWLGAMLTSAEPRGKQGHIAPEGFNFWPQNGHHIVDVMGNAESPPFNKSLKNMLLLQSLHAKLHGFPTSGCALNTMTLLLQLVKPLKPEQANTFSAFFTLRKDSECLLGNWLKESRFGEEAQVTEARDTAASDPAFAGALYDKALFKSQIFWLASKGIGTLLLPVLKEAFHAMQNVAAYFVQKDRQIADTAWREYLLAEATLKEPAFLEKLGHLVDLTFRFLTHVAAGGQEALPPPKPGAEWNALPSTVLENVLDVLDLYRDRDRQSKITIPTGLYAHLDPTYVLTTLCVVMASDEHVRDPSLRGRAVKLLHRLCIAFPAWQDRLSQAPLKQHLIPCLINVFIAVEKAIMSYYDLSYRFKYELRVPVMELFELALEKEEHRTVLDSFVRGQGNDRFLKLLTQLINDSNSQTEEAIRTVKEYHEKQRNGEEDEVVPPPAASGASGSGGGQHDEQVLDDDQGDGAEDIYRRSRMNYKEHAKKYFGLASKTWKTLWLICKHCAPVIVEGRTILEQLLHTSLDAQLHFLVGPEMKMIKSSPQEYDELGFSPKELIRQIAEIYLFLSRVNRDEVARIVAKDERYYSPATFSKAVNFIRKYTLLSGDCVEEFEKFNKELSDRVSQQRAAFDQADIPANYLCEMMADIMSDPVQFPQSKKIVDRWVAVRQIMGTDRDPYANTPVKVEELVPLTALKEEIHKFAKEKGISLEGGNMFD